MEAYCVVVGKKADASNILGNSIKRKRGRKHKILIMKSELSKNQAIEEVAVSLENQKSKRGN